MTESHRSSHLPPLNSAASGSSRFGDAAESMTLALSKPNELARRIARGEARSYWEQNLVDGHLAAIQRLVSWMHPLEGRRILVAADGEGHLARRLASFGAQVVGCDSVAGSELGDGAFRDGCAVTGEVALHTASASDILDSDQDLQDVVLWEALERLDQNQGDRLYAAIESAAPERLYIALRLQPKWSRWLPSYPGAELPTADPVRTLRSLHLATDYRLHRHDTITRRNSALRVLELHPLWRMAEEGMNR